MDLQTFNYKYPLDLTGKDPLNLVTNEIHKPVGSVNKVIVPNHGGYYSHSLSILDLTSGTKLTPKVQFKAVQLYQEATKLTGLEVAAAIVITDVNVGSKVSITYQAIGGEFSVSVAALREVIESLNIDDRPVAWGDMLGKPDLFPPAPHLHDVGDVYGFEYLVNSLDTLKNAVLVGNEGALNELRNQIVYVNQRVNKLQALYEELLCKIEATNDDLSCATNNTLYYEHLNRVLAHNTTIETIGLDKLVNKKLLTIYALRSALDSKILALKNNG